MLHPYESSGWKTLLAGVAPESGQGVFQVPEKPPLQVVAAVPSASPHKHQERLQVLLLNDTVCVCVCARIRGMLSVLIFISCLVDTSFCFAERKVLEENETYRAYMNYTVCMLWLLLF